MVFGKGWEEVFCHPSMELFNQAREILQGAEIRFRFKLNQRDSAPPLRAPARNLMGRVGENTAVSAMHYLFVSKADAEKAKHLLEALYRTE